MSEKYQLKLDSFEGPLDLLLHLIKVHEIDIFKIDILELATQYLNYLRVMEFKDLSQAADFIRMAANLIEMKSRYLLPRDENDAQKDEDEEDLALKLQQRLLEYDQFRKVAESFHAKVNVDDLTVSNHAHTELEERYADHSKPLKGDMATFMAMYEEILKDFVVRKPGKVIAKMHRISVEETIEGMLRYIEQVKFSLFQSMYGKFNDRYEFVANILAMLDLCKQGDIKTYQNDLSGPLWLYHKLADRESLPFSLEHMQDWMASQSPA